MLVSNVALEPSPHFSDKMRVPKLPSVLSPTPAWNELSGLARKQCWDAAIDLVDSMQTLGARGKQVVNCIVGDQEFIEWDHYPDNDVRDNKHRSQYFYHAHPGLQRPFAEHGHFHLFIHAEELGLRRHDPRFSPAPAHLLAVSMDAQGLPNGFFLVNRWVTKGAWLSLAQCEIGLQQFQIKGRHGNKEINTFLLALIRLYHAPIIALIKQRDEIMHRLSLGRDRRSVFADKQIEVLCYHPIQLVNDITTIETLMHID